MLNSFNSNNMNQNQNNMINSTNNMNFIPNNNMNLNPNNTMNFIPNNNMNFIPNNNMNFNPNNNMNFNPNNNMNLNPNNNMNLNPNNKNIPFLGNNNTFINYNINNVNINNFNNNSNTNRVININHFTQPSNLISPAYLYFKNKNKCLKMEFSLNDNSYILEIEKIDEHNCLYFFCNRKDDDVILLYEYTCVQTVEEIRKKNKSFQICENLDEIFNTLKNIFSKLYREAKPRIDISNEQIILYFINPNLADTYEDTTIYLDKHSRDVNTQFPKLQFKYVELSQHLKEIKKICASSDKSNLKIQKILAILDDPSYITGQEI